MKLGMITYNLGRNWDLPTILRHCRAARFEGVEFRTGHAHKVEADLTPAARQGVRKMCADAGIEIVGLGTAFEFHSTDPAVVRRNIEGTKKYVVLAHDLGCLGVKVRPNGENLKQGVPLETTLRQIGQALRECGEFAQGYGVDIRLEIHGGTTALVPNARKIIDYAAHPGVSLVWNSNASDVENGSVEKNFRLVERWIHEVHLRDLSDASYPWRQLFHLLNNSGYEGYCLAEIPESCEPDRLMGYFRALWLAYQV